MNEAKPGRVVEHVLRRAERFTRPRIACLGLAYKPDVDDLRESPAVAIAERLDAESEAEVIVVEPNLTRHDRFELHPLEDALQRADIVLVLVAHRPFSRIPAASLAEKIVIDTCGGLSDTVAGRLVSRGG